MTPGEGGGRDVPTRCCPLISREGLVPTDPTPPQPRSPHARAADAQSPPQVRHRRGGEERAVCSSGGCASAHLDSLLGGAQVPQQ